MILNPDNGSMANIKSDIGKLNIERNMVKYRNLGTGTKIQQETAMAYLKVVPQYSPRVNKEYHGKPESG
jgi:hypothetical protein